SRKAHHYWEGLMRTSYTKRLIRQASATLILASIVLLTTSWLPLAQRSVEAAPGAPSGLNAPAAVPTPIVTDRVNGFELDQNSVFWWNTLGIFGCPSGEFYNVASIKLRGILSAPDKTLEDKRCPILLSPVGSVVRDSLYLYYFENKQLVRKSVSASAGDP